MRTASSTPGACSDEQASAFDLVLYIERFGEDQESFWRRLSQVYELDAVVDGWPRGRTLYRWLAEDDRFEAAEAPRTFAAERSDLEARAAALAELARSGRTSEGDVAAALAAYRARRDR